MTSEGFLSELFGGRCRFELLDPFPVQSDEDAEIGDRFLARFEADLRRFVDPDAIDEQGEIPGATLAALADRGYFGIGIPSEYGGSGLSLTNTYRAVGLLGSYCRSTAATLFCHACMGATRPLLLFGTEEQRRRLLPRLASGALSGFAVTEPGAGNDITAVKTRAVPLEGGREWLVTGEKLFITNSPIAEYLCVFAQTPGSNGAPAGFTLAIVNTRSPGYRVLERCRFAGLRGVANGLVRLDGVRVPAENIVGVPGKAFEYLHPLVVYGWLSITAISSALAAACVRAAKQWASERVQWGAPIGMHQAVRKLLARISANAYAIQTMHRYCVSLAETGHPELVFSCRLAKAFVQERGWQITEDTLQLRAARGFERATSLARRDARARRGGGGLPEDPFPIERIFRDTRIFRIGEGSSQTLPLLNSFDVILAAARASTQPSKGPCESTTLPNLRSGSCSLHAKAVSGLAWELRTTVDRVVEEYGDSLGEEQLLLTRVGNAAADLFAMTLALSRANDLVGRGLPELAVLPLADAFCLEARDRVDRELANPYANHSAEIRLVSDELLSKQYDWLTRDAVL
jgi:hypothetical protein